MGSLGINTTLSLNDFLERFRHRCAEFIYFGFLNDKAVMHRECSDSLSLEFQHDVLGDLRIRL